MKFRDVLTKSVIETHNDFVIEQCKKYPDRYKEIKPEPKKEDSK